MRYNPEIHHRGTIRLGGYDYSSSGAYFVTVCTRNRECLFGEIKDGQMVLNEYGKIVENEWLKTFDVRKNVRLDYYVVMPNHFHGILVLSENVGATRRVAQNYNNNINYTGNGCIPMKNRAFQRNAPTGLKSNTIGAIIGQFKSVVTKQINQIRATPGIPVWQRNYYEHIVRNDIDLNLIHKYILDNPLRWTEDEENPVNTKKFYYT